MILSFAQVFINITSTIHVLCNRLFGFAHLSNKKAMSQMWTTK